MPVHDRPLYAHTLPNHPPADWETLAEHSHEVEAAAAAFAQHFGAETWGKVLGRCHDLGKASDAFQSYISSASAKDQADAGEEHPSAKRVDHSTFGARYVARLPGIAGALLAFCIAGHHGCLPDWDGGEAATAGGTLEERLRHKAIPFVPDPELTLPTPALPWPLPRTRPDRDFALAFFTRMLFSTLIDADRTCTEAVCNPEQAAERRLARPTVKQLGEALRKHLAGLEQSAKNTPVNAQRRRVLEECRAKATLSPGFFSLQVPTGGGKTLSSLSFALEHAGVHKMSRVVMAIPFTSIIEQTADVYRDALGGLADLGLIEHHTNLRPERETRANKLGSETWDAPLVVTTNVQLLESLFAAATTPCRKLHRLAKSVIILDEAQTLPVELLEPTLAALRELVERYGCSVVLCTATQPALEQRDDFKIGLRRVRPIIADPQPLFAALKRVHVHHLGKVRDEELAERLAKEPRALAIVNTRPHAVRLFDLVAENTEHGTCFHLSTLMCGAHRRKVLATVRERLKTDGVPCRVISTQLVEAGVDLSVPVVYRAAAGLDSIAQAAGRCNREGEQPVGNTYVFEAEQLPPPGYLRRAWQAGTEVLPRFPEDPLAPAAMDAYFKRLYWDHREEWDKEQIMRKMELDLTPGRWPARMQFREIADRYRIIQDTQLPVLVPYDDVARSFLQELDRGHVEYVSQRLLQPYLVSVPQRTVRDMESRGALRLHESGVWMCLREDIYDKEGKGLQLEGFGLDPNAWGV